MKTIFLVLLLLFASCAKADGQDDLVQKVSDIAALTVRNTDSIDELKARVQSIETNQTQFLGRLQALEDKVFGTAVVTPVETFVPFVETILPTPRVILEGPQAIRTKTVSRPVVESRRTPVRSVFRRLFPRRVTTVSYGSSSHWSYPGDIVSHLTGYPHYLSLSYVSQLSYYQQLAIHDTLHGG